MRRLFEGSSGNFVQWLNQTYGIQYRCLRPDLAIQGSPERSFDRVVFEDDTGGLLICEQFETERYRSKYRIARTLDHLRSAGLNEIIPCVRTRENRHLPEFEGRLFQLSPFVLSPPLQRPDYLSNGAMGENLARFLVQLSRVSGCLSNGSDVSLFSIKTYILRMAKEMKRHDPIQFSRYRGVLVHLFEHFMTVHDQLPVSFVHGDYHPMNVIWHNSEITAVIDWEFCGMKPRIYDAANLVGCAGIEDPEGLGMAMVKTFMACLEQTDLFCAFSRQWFAAYVLALRFAWLSEWLRRKDEQMLDLEVRYMKILMDHGDDLTALWFR